MKHRFLLTAIAVVAAGAANATLFTDPMNDQGPTNGGGAGFPHLDITAVNVTNTASTITFAFTLQGDIAATNWGKYGVVFRNLSNATVDNGANNNAWGRSGHLSGGANGWIGSWVDSGGGAQAWTYNGAWNMNNGAIAPTLSQFGTSITVNLSDLGLALGDTIIFDAVTTANGGSDTMTDSLTGATPAEWSTVVDMTGNTYVLQAVPEPATMTLFAGAAALAALRRRKK